MTDCSIPNSDLEEVAKAFTQIADGEAVAFRTVDPHGRDGMQMVYGDLRKSSAYIAIPVHSWEEGWRLRKRCYLLTLDAIDQLKYVLEQLTAHPGLFGSYEYGAALATFKEATQEAVKNLALAEIDHKIRTAEAGISMLKKNRDKLNKAGADAYEIFTRPLYNTP